MGEPNDFYNEWGFGGAFISTDLHDGGDGEDERLGEHLIDRSCAQDTFHPVFDRFNI